MNFSMISSIFRFLTFSAKSTGKKRQIDQHTVVCGSGPHIDMRRSDLSFPCRIGVHTLAHLDLYHTSSLSEAHRKSWNLAGIVLHPWYLVAHSIELPSATWFGRCWIGCTFLRWICRQWDSWTNLQYPNLYERVQVESIQVCRQTLLSQSSSKPGQLVYHWWLLFAVPLEITQNLRISQRVLEDGWYRDRQEKHCLVWCPDAILTSVQLRLW